MHVTRILKKYSQFRPAFFSRLAVQIQSVRVPSVAELLALDGVVVGAGRVRARRRHLCEEAAAARLVAGGRGVGGAAVRGGAAHARAARAGMEGGNKEFSLVSDAKLAFRNITTAIQ